MTSCIKTIFYAFHIHKLAEAQNISTMTTALLSCFSLIPVMGVIVSCWGIPNFEDFPEYLTPSARIRGLVTLLTFGVLTIVLDIIVALGVFLHNKFCSFPNK